MNIKKLQELINEGESSNTEFKTSFDNATIETITAFANTAGGSVMVGVSNSGSITGVDIGAETLQQWLNKIKLQTSPAIIPNIDQIEYKHKQIVVISVSEYPIKPVSTKGRYYKRVKNSNHQMDIGEISNMHLQTVNTSWDFYKDVHHTISDISLDKVNLFIKLANKNRLNHIEDSPIDVLNKFELVREGGITNGCFLLFTKNETLLTGIELGRFADPITIKDSITSRTDLFAEVDKIIEFVQKHINKSYIITGAAQREERWEYPMEAIREIAINMVVHRDYMDSGDSIIKIFDGRIEFFNPGGLISGLSVEQLLSGDYTSRVRNKQISSMFKEVGLIERYGSGIGRIRNLCLVHGLPEPRFEEIQKGFRVIVYKATQKASKKISNEGISEGINEGISEGINQLFSIIQRNPGQRTPFFVAKLNTSVKNIERWLRTLKDNHKIEYHGSKKTGGYYVVK